MPSPFPGMDPFIESCVWDDFHGSYVPDTADALVPLVRPNYVVRRERHVYVTSGDADDEQERARELIESARNRRPGSPS